MLTISLAFKKVLGAALQSAQYVILSTVMLEAACSTANLCAIDLSKAFDKVNHDALFLKLMKRRIPNELLNILVVWLSCYLCVKWLNVWSDMFRVDFGVRQGSVLSPFLFCSLLRRFG